MLEKFQDLIRPFDDGDETEEETEDSEATQEPESSLPSDEMRTDDSTDGQIIGFMSGKGGVGKTGLAINVANFCAENGAKVLLVDCDLSTNGATTFFRTREDIKNLFRRRTNILTMHDMLTSVMDDGNPTNTNNIPTSVPVTIKQNYDFIPASIVGGRFDEQGLIAESLPQFEDAFVSKWRKEYDLIIFDFGAGAGLLNSMLSQLPEKICIVMRPNDIARQAVRRQLGFLFRGCNLDNLICCINMLTPRKRIVNTGALFHEFPGFLSSAEYAQLYDSGKMIDISNSFLCRHLCEIVRNVYDDRRVLRFYFEKTGMDDCDEYESPEDTAEKAEKQQLRRLLIAIFLCSILLCASFMVILILKAWDKIPVWGNLVFTVGIIAFEVCVLIAVQKLNPRK